MCLCVYVSVYSPYVDVCIYVCTCVYVRIRVCYVRMCTHTFIYVFTFLCGRVFVYVYVCVSRTCVFVWMCSHVCERVSVWVRTQGHTGVGMGRVRAGPHERGTRVTPTTVEGSLGRSRPVSERPRCGPNIYRTP